MLAPTPTGRPFSDLGARLLELRRRSGLTQKEVAARAGISEGYVSSLEKGRYQPASDVLRLLARVLGGEFNELARLADYIGDESGAPWTPPPDKADVLSRMGRQFPGDLLEDLERIGRALLLKSVPPPGGVAEQPAQYEPGEHEPHP